MLEVKKTPSGKFTLKLSLECRECIWTSLVNFLEDESVKISSLKLIYPDTISRAIYYHLLNEFADRIDFSLQTKKVKQWSVKRSEAIALMWSLRDYQDLTSLRIKAGLHKQLHS